MLSEIDCKPHLKNIQVSAGHTVVRRDVIRIHRMHVVEHHPGIRVQIPVQAESVIGCDAGSLVVVRPSSMSM